MRVAHFFGLHALQVVPLLGFLIASLRSIWLGVRDQVVLVWVAKLAYLGLLQLLAWQTLRGQPVILPDALTLGALCVVIATAGGVASAVALHAYRKTGKR